MMMRYLLKYKTFENYNEDFEYLKDILSDLRDYYDVLFYEMNVSEYRVVIKRQDSKTFTINKDISETLKRAVDYMQKSGFQYSARYRSHDDVSTKRFYIHLDERDLRVLGTRIDVNWPQIYAIDLRFYI